MSSIPQVILPDQFNAADAFLDRHLREGRGARPALSHQDQLYTYAQVVELANRVGNGLRELGVEQEQRVALLLLDSPEFAAAFFGGMKIGAVPVPINTALRQNDYVYMLNDSRAKVLLISAEVWPTVQSVLSELTSLRHTVVVGLRRSGQAESAALHDFEHWVSQAVSSLETARTSKDDSAF